MSLVAARLRSVPVGTALLLAAAGLVWVVLLLDLPMSRGGEVGDAVVGEGIFALFLILVLWSLIALLLVVGATRGKLPRAAAWSAVVLLPLAGVATAIGVDMCSHYLNGGLLFPLVLPPAVALAALWARLPSLRRLAPVGSICLATWSGVGFLSVVACLISV